MIRLEMLSNIYTHCCDSIPRRFSRIVPMSSPGKENEEEEDFLAMLDGPVVEPVPKLIEASSPPPNHHILSSDTDDELPVAEAHQEPIAIDTYFQTVLTEFYSRFNFNNLQRVAYIAEKFQFRRWQLWEQLTIKYHLSPNDSRLLWINFNINHDGMPECSRRLFGDHEMIRVDDGPNTRRTHWKHMLGVDASDEQKNLYAKYVLETLDLSAREANTEKIDEILRDVDRTHQELAFFQDQGTRDSMIQILRVYTNLNGVKYVQGMNEILALVFYVMRDEADAFWGFNTIMLQLKEIFTADADSTQEGIYSRIDSLNELLREYNHRLAKQFSSIDFPLATLAMRWITTILAMDLTIPDALIVWDYALQAIRANQLVSFTVCVSLAYLLAMEDELIESKERQACIELVGKFGRSASMDGNGLIVTALSVFAYESTLRGRYPANSDEPILDAFVDAMGVAKSRVLDAMNSDSAVRVREDLANKVSSAKSTVKNWFGSWANDIEYFHSSANPPGDANSGGMESDIRE
jgi:hypothetical protein